MLKHEKVIKIRNERLIKVRNNLRKILIKSIYDEIEILRNYDSLYGAWLNLAPAEQKEVAYLQGTKHELLSLLRKSICVCPICTKTDRDMIFIPHHKSWFCTDCHEKGLIWYHPRGSEEDRRQHDYINWYLEQKEKFAKKFSKK